MKLDLLNSRIEIPRGNRVYDSLENRSLASYDHNLGHSSSAKISDIPAKGRCHQMRTLTSGLPARFESIKVDRKGHIVEVQDRHVNRYSESNVSPSRGTTSMKGGSNMLHTQSTPNILTFKLPGEEDYYDPKELIATIASNMPPSRVGTASTINTSGGGTAVTSTASYSTPIKNMPLSPSGGTVTSPLSPGKSISSSTVKSSLRRSTSKRNDKDGDNESIIDSFGVKDVDPKHMFSPILDRMKDRIHDDHSYTVKARLDSKKLPGAHWPSGSKEDSDVFKHGCTDPQVGPGSYEVYGSIPTARNVVLATSKNHFVKGVDDIIPLKERLRMERQEQTIKECWPSIVNAEEEREHHKMTKKLDCPLITQKLHLPDIKFAPSREHAHHLDRFRALEYRQEGYIKTTGLVLGPDYDKKFDKRIPFAFETSTSSGNLFAHESAGKEVDVDVGKFYSIVEEANRSPVRYSSAFRSKAKVGMEIPKTTSAPHIGPGSFADAIKPAIEVYRPDLNSLAFLSSRLWPVRPPMPEFSEKIPSFAEANRRGPLFPTERSADGPDPRNQHMATVVKEKMTQIYPRLAKKKFPEKPSPERRRTKRIK